LTASEERFDGFVREASPGLLRAAWLMVGDWWAAEDLVQAAFEKTWPGWGRLADDGQRLAYLHRVVANAFMRGRRRKWTGEIATSELPQCAAADETDALVLRASVVAAVRGLPPRQRAVIALRQGVARTGTRNSQAGMALWPTLPGHVICADRISERPSWQALARGNS